ncbi:MAG: hypothetical protein HQM12_03065 [SAR324 cluster bacterium]|nr:hypothetical protein [SAR324 cluster bacterium]
MKIEFVIDDSIHYPLNYSNLARIVDCIEDNVEQQDLFHVLAQSEFTRIRECIAGMDCLHEETVHLLAHDPQIEVLRRIISSDSGKKYLTTETLLQLVEQGDYEVMDTLSSRLEEYQLCNIEQVFQKMIEHPDPAVRYKLATNRDIPAKLRQKLAKAPDPLLAKLAQKNLK